MRKVWATQLDSIYQALGKSRSRGHHQVVRHTRKRLTWIFVGWTLVCTILVLVARHWLSFSGTPSASPILSGPPEFIILAIILALAAYLRSIRGEAVRFRESIRSDSAWNYPLRKPYIHYSEAKMALLDGIVETLNIAGSFVIVLFVVVGIRILADSVLRFFGDAQKTAWLFVADFVIASWIVTIFVALTIAHGIARSHDDDIRAIAIDCEGEVLATRLSTHSPRTKPDLTATSSAEKRSRVLAKGVLLIGLLVTFGGLLDPRKE
jgi:hypothetical protein